ncbi:MAG: BA14K family protein [Hyphomicrobiales bacterium]
MKSLLVGSMAAAIAIAMLAASPSRAQPAGPTAGFGAADTTLVQDVQYVRRGARIVGRPGFRGGAQAFRRGGRWQGGGFRGGGRGAAAAGIAGVAAGALLGGMLASPPDPGPGYYVPDPGYPSGDPIAYCQSRFRSYDPRSGTYIGNDGYRYRCP